jgi:AcrR family transcriptional regulator
LGRLAAWFAPSVIRGWYLYIVKISVTGSRNGVKQNLYSVKIAVYNFFMTARFGSAKKPLTASAPVRKRVAKSVATKKPAAKKAASAAAATYHHGDLREALLKAAEKILERDGLTGLTLRAVAREAGVSHAAPAHHFGDLTGLVSELAAIGFRQFNAAMIAADAAGTTPIEKARARANNYVGYARAHPGMYTLMFRTERLDMSRPALKEAANASFASLVGAVGAGRRERIAEETLTLDQAADIVRAWSLVHGFTTLLLDDRLSDVLRRLPAGNDADTLLLAMLRRANTPMVPQS